MNLRLVLKIVGRVLLFESLTLLPPLGVALWYGEDPMPFVSTFVLVAFLGAFLASLSAPPTFFAREGFCCVGMIWVLTGILGSLPFYLSGAVPSFVDCLFESFSGFTTTGGTVLPDVEILPQGVQFWRCFSHWLGGMGVLSLPRRFCPPWASAPTS